MSASSTPGRARSSWGYLLLALAALGVVALILPWFRPTIGGHSVEGTATTHSWNGVLFFVAPLLMIFTAVRAVTAGGDVTAQRRVSRQAALSGGLLLISAAVGWARVPSNYADWKAAQDYARSVGLPLGRGPLIGFWLSLAVGVLFLALGV